MNLIHNLSSLVYKPAEGRIFLTGARNTGKTTFLYHLKLGRAIETVPTFGIGTESLKYNNKSFLIHDVGDCLDRQARPFLRWHLDSQAFVFFLHDCSRSGNTVESTNVLHEHVKDLLDSGTRFLWIVLNKLDAGDVVETRNAARFAKCHFEHEMEQYDGRLVWKIILLGGLSGQTRGRVLDAIDDIWPTFKACREFAPVPESTKPEVLQIRTSQDGRTCSLRGLEGLPSELDSNAFWQAFQDGTIPSWTHRDRLRAAYMVLLKARERNQGILELAEPFRIKENAIHGNHSAWNR
jgi:ADP-ribosylation factor family